MIHVVVGTKAQLIKMAPVMRRMSERAIPYHYIASGQHRNTMAEIHANFGIREPDTHVYQGPEVRTIPQMLGFGIKVLANTMRAPRTIFRGDRRGIVLVHGDTVSTLLGAVMARVAGLKVGHVEAGLRSYRLLSPFPEEIIRMATFYLADYYFCPDKLAMNNLRRLNGEKIDTGGNTLGDALSYAMRALGSRTLWRGLDPPYGVVTVHRHENIRSNRALRRVIDAVRLIAERHRLMFVLHSPTEIKLRRFDYYDALANHPNIILRPRFDYFDFMRIVMDAEFVVSDGGSNQEECHYLGKPLLLLREVTERSEGLGENAVLSRFDPDLIRRFRDEYPQFRREPVRRGTSPSDIIIDACTTFQ